MIRITLPFPPAILSGHTGGDGMGKWKKIKEVKFRREMAMECAKEVMQEAGYTPPETGDIAIHITFTPPDNRGDRVNFAARMKAYIDGIAEALGVNDKRFLPYYRFLPNEKPGGVTIDIAKG